MQTYTSILRKPLDTISWEDDNFMEELLQVVQLFRPFSEALDEFLKEHGYAKAFSHGRIDHDPQITAFS